MKGTIARIFFFVLSISAIVVLAVLLQPILDGKASADIAYLPSSDFVKMISLGYRELAADIYWFKAVQYYGGYRLSQNDIHFFNHLAGMITDLDPNFLGAYKLSGIVITEDLGNFAAAKSLMEKGEEIESKGKEQLEKAKMPPEAKKEGQQELDRLKEQFSKQRFTLSDDKLAELSKKIEDKSIEMKRFQDDAQRELEDARRKALSDLEQRIMPIIQQLGKEKGYLLIFQKYQSGLVYADDARTDITDEVIRRFNTSQQ